MLKTIGALIIAVLAVEGLNTATGGELYVASLRSLAQESTQAPVAPPPATFQQEPIQQPLPPQEPQIEQQPPFEENGRNYIDPEEIKGSLREIKDLKLEFRRLAAKAKKVKAYAEALAKINEVLAELDKYQKLLSNKSVENLELREANDEFRENNYWDELEKFRLKIEFPKEAKQINLILKRLEKMIKQKAFAKLGLNFDKVTEYIAETRGLIDAIQAHLNAGEIEEAIEVMRSQGDRPHPGEIEGTLHRIRDIKQRMNRIKDAAIRAEIDGVLQDVINAFNEGEYRDANQTLDEYADDLLDLINKLTRVRWSDEEKFSRIRGLEELINSKLQQMDAEQEQQEQPQPPQGIRF